MKENNPALTAHRSKTQNEAGHARTKGVASTTLNQNDSTSKSVPKSAQKSAPISACNFDDADPFLYLARFDAEALRALKPPVLEQLVASARRRIEQRLAAQEITTEVTQHFRILVAAASSSGDSGLTRCVVSLALSHAFLRGELVNRLLWSPVDKAFSHDDRVALVKASDERASTYLLALLSFTKEERRDLFQELRGQNVILSSLRSVEELEALAPEGSNPFNCPLRVLAGKSPAIEAAESARRLLDLRTEIGPRAWSKLFTTVSGINYRSLPDRQLRFYGRLCAEDHPFERAVLYHDETIAHLNQMGAAFIDAFEAALDAPAAHARVALDLLRTCGVSVDRYSRIVDMVEADPGGPRSFEEARDLAQLICWGLSLQHCQECSGIPGPELWALLRRTLRLGSGPEDIDPLELGSSARAAEIVAALRRNESLWGEILRSPSVAGSAYDVRRLLRMPNFEGTLHLLGRSLSRLSSDLPEHERLASLASDVAIASARNAPGGLPIMSSRICLRVEDQLIPFAEIPPERLRGELAAEIRRAIHLDADDLFAANARNFGIARMLKKRGVGFVLSPGTYLHTTSEGALGAIIRSANLPGEAVGRATGADGIPGFVDVQKVKNDWRSNRVGSLRDGGELKKNRGAIIAYDPSVLRTPIPAATEYKDHALFLGGVSNAAAMYLIVPQDGPAAEDARLASVERGLYIPIVTDGGQLLFSPSEFNRRLKAYKRFDTLNELLESQSVFSEHHRATPDPGGVESIADHCETVRRNCRALMERTALPEELIGVVELAGKLHDVGKQPGLVQEITNVAAAEDLLKRVKVRDLESERKILLLIKYDELLGALLKDMHPQPSGGFVVGERGREKLETLKRVFSGPEMRLSLQALYEADVVAKGGGWYERWSVGEKLASLGLDPLWTPPVEGEPGATDRAARPSHRP